MLPLICNCWLLVFLALDLNAGLFCRLFGRVFVPSVAPVTLVGIQAFGLNWHLSHEWKQGLLVRFQEDLGTSSICFVSIGYKVIGKNGNGTFLHAAPHLWSNIA